MFVNIRVHVRVIKIYLKKNKYIRKNDSIFLFKTLVFQHYYKICFIVQTVHVHYNNQQNFFSYFK